LKKHRRKDLGLRNLVRPAFFLAVSIMLSLWSMRSVGADVPNVLQIVDISQPSMGRIRLQIRHANPSSSHYVNEVEVDINGQVTKFNLQPQTTNPFTVELDLGVFQGKPNVRARANCNLHGWSSWSDQIQIPEFVRVTPLLFAALAASLVITKRIRK